MWTHHIQCTNSILLLHRWANRSRWRACEYTVVMPQERTPYLSLISTRRFLTLVSQSSISLDKGTWVRMEVQLVRPLLININNSMVSRVPSNLQMHWPRWPTPTQLTQVEGHRTASSRVQLETWTRCRLRILDQASCSTGLSSRSTKVLASTSPSIWLVLVMGMERKLLSTAHDLHMAFQVSQAERKMATSNLVVLSSLNFLWKSQVENLMHLCCRRLVVYQLQIRQLSRLAREAR